MIKKLKENSLVAWKMSKGIWLIFMRANLDSNNFHRISANLYFDGLLLSKTYKVLDEKGQSYVSWHWRVMQSLNKNWNLVPKVSWEIWWILLRPLASLKICTLMCYICQQRIKFQVEKVQKTIAHDTEERHKLWRKTEFGNW